MKKKKLTNEVGAVVIDNTNSLTAGTRGPILLEDNWLLEKLAHFDREVIPERRMHAKGSGAFGTFTTTHDVTLYTCASLFSKINPHKVAQTPLDPPKKHQRHGKEKEKHCGIDTRHHGRLSQRAQTTPQNSRRLRQIDEQYRLDISHI